MKDYAFISRHIPTVQQLELTKTHGINLLCVGDHDGFETDQVKGNLKDFVGVFVIHPAMALNLITHFPVGVFKNENRAPVGSPPKFETKSFKIWEMDSKKFNFIITNYK